MSNVKRFRFTLREILAFMAMLCVPLAMWPLGIRSENEFVRALGFYFAVLSTGGVLGASVGWLISRTWTGLSVGYILGLFAIIVIPAILFLVLASFPVG